MASVKGVSTYLEHLDSKKNSLRKAILSLAVEWKDLDEHLDTTKQCFDDCVVDLESKERILECNRESVAESIRELDEVRQSLDLRFLELECREESFRCFQLSQMKELEMKEEQLDVSRAWIRERLEEYEMKEERLSVQKKTMELLLEKIEREKEEFQDIQKSVGEKLDEICLKERNYEELSKEVILIQGRMETWARELHSKEEQLEVVEKLNKERSEELDVIAQECELKEERLSVEKDSMEVLLKKIEVEKEKIEDSKESIAEKLNEISLKERNCEDLCKEANLIQDWTERRARELYLKEEEFALREEQLKKMQKLNEERCEELDFIAQECKLREERLGEEKKSIAALLQKFEDIENSVGESLKEINFKEKNYEGLYEELNLIQGQIERQARELDSKAEQIAWREEQLEQLQKLNKECREQLDAFEKECKSKEERLSVQKEEFEDVKRSFAEKLNEISLKEKNCENQSRELDKVKNWIEKRAKELDLKEEEVELREQQIDAMQIVNLEHCKAPDVIAQKWKSRGETTSVEKEEVENIDKSISQKLNEIGLKEWNHESRYIEPDKINDWINRRAKKLDLKGEEAELRERQVEAMRLNSAKKFVDKCHEKLDWKEKQLDSAQKHINQCFKNFHSKNNHFKDDQMFDRGKEFESKEKQHEESLKEFESKHKQLEEGLKDFESKEKQLEGRLKLTKKIEERLKEFESKVKRFEERSKVLELTSNQLQNQIERRARELDLKEQEIALREEQLKETRILNDECCEELDAIEKACKLKEERLRVEKKELEDLQKSVAKKLNEICLKERNYEDRSRELDNIKDYLERQAKELDLKGEEVKLREQQLEAMQILNDERRKELDVIAQEWKSKEERFMLEKKLVEERSEMIRKEKEEFEDSRGATGKKLEEIRLKEKECEDLSKEVNLMLDWIERRAGELELKEQEVAVREEQFNAMPRMNKGNCEELDISLPKCKLEGDCLSMEKKSLDVLLGEIEEEKKELDIVMEGRGFAEKISDTCCKGLDWKEKRSSSTQKHINQCCNDFHSENNHFKVDKELVVKCCEGLESKGKKPEEHLKDFESNVKQLKEQWKYSESKAEQFGDWSKALELTAEQFQERSRGNIFKKNQCDNVVHSNAKVEQVEERAAVNLPTATGELGNMDGRCLLLFLKDCNSKNKEVCKILLLSPDPAKLVLHAMEGFCLPHLRKGDIDFENRVMRKCCVILLEQLMLLSPHIQLDIREAAFILACKLKSKIKGFLENHFEALVFILLLASYKLASEFDANEILGFLEFFAMRKLAPNICRAIDFSEKVPDLVGMLIRNNKHRVAVRFVIEFELIEKFPPITLLRDYLRSSKKRIRKRCREENNTVEARDKALGELIACRRHIIKCINDHQLECGRWRYELEKNIKNIKDQKGKKRAEQTFIINNMVQKSNVHRRCSSSKMSLSYLLADMDGNNLIHFLIKHVEEHNQLRREISDALRMSSDYGKLVLDAMQVFYISYLMKEGSDIEANAVRTCIFLLEESMEINRSENSPGIKPQVKEAATELAFDWRSIILKQSTYGLTLAFLLFVGTYGLTSAFDFEEILKLYKTIEEDEHAFELFQVLGLSAKIPVCSTLGQSAPKDLRLSNRVTSIVSVSDPHSLWDGIPEAIRFASDPAQLVLDAVEGCYYSMLKNSSISKVRTLRNFSFLLNRLLRVPLEVKPQVKDQVKKLAADWETKLKSDPFEANCLLLLITTFKVLSSFNMDSLLNLFEIVYNDKVPNHLFQSIGLSDVVPDFIGKLVERRLNLYAIKYVYAFDLIEKFSPITLLEGYINNAKEEAEKFCEDGHNTLRSQERAAKQQLKAFEAALSCAWLHRLELQHPLKNLEELTRQLRTLYLHLRKMNRKRERGGFPHDLPTSTQCELHHPKKMQRATLPAEAALPTHPAYQHQGKYPVACPPYLQPQPREYFPGASTSKPVLEYFSGASTSKPVGAIGLGALANGGYPPFGFGGGVNFNLGPSYNARPIMLRWSLLGPGPNRQ